MFKIYTKQIQYKDNYGPEVRTVDHVEAETLHSRGYSSDDIFDMIFQDFDRSCGCEHDCCGHYFGGIVNHRKIGEFTWIVETHYIMNV